MVGGRQERETPLHLLARGRVRRVLAQVGGEAVGEHLDVVAGRPRAAGLDSSEHRVGRAAREARVARGRRPRHRVDHVRARALWGRRRAPRRRRGHGETLKSWGPLSSLGEQSVRLGARHAGRARFTVLQRKRTDTRRDREEMLPIDNLSNCHGRYRTVRVHGDLTYSSRESAVST